MKNASGLILFDLDDTLVDTSDIYWKSRSEFIKLMAELGYDSDYVLEKFEEIDSRNLSKFGYVPQRYCTSMLDAYKFLVLSNNQNAIISIENKIKKIGAIVRDEVPGLIDGALELLDRVKSNGFRSVLITRGIEEVQRKKIRTHGLEKYFDKIEIVLNNKVDLFRREIADAAISLDKCWVVGDSIKSDINPGLEVGAACVLFLYSHPFYFWRQEYGQTPNGDFYLSYSLQNISKIIMNPGMFQKTNVIPVLPS
jgi:putative hydrolase of the HAD superfamily